MLTEAMLRGIAASVILCCMLGNTGNRVVPDLYSRCLLGSCSGSVSLSSYCKTYNSGHYCPVLSSSLISPHQAWKISTHKNPGPERTDLIRVGIPTIIAELSVMLAIIVMLRQAAVSGYNSSSLTYYLHHELQRISIKILEGKYSSTK